MDGLRAIIIKSKIWHHEKKYLPSITKKISSFLCRGSYLTLRISCECIFKKYHFSVFTDTQKMIKQLSFSKTVYDLPTKLHSTHVPKLIRIVGTPFSCISWIYDFILFSCNDLQGTLLRKHRRKQI